MSNNNALKTYINNTIYENNTQQITGAILNTVLNSMVNTLGAGYQFAGVAHIALTPTTPDARIFYLAGEGIYTGFGGIVVPQGKLGILKWDTSWHLETIDGLGGGGSNLTGYVSVATVNDLPDVGVDTLGYLCGNELYLYVGEGGDTLDGKYQNCGSFRGPQGYSVQDIEQTQTSNENAGVNVVRITLSNGMYFDFQVRNGTTSTGLFPSTTALNTAYPNPVVGQYAFVGTGFPADIYVCQTEGTWEDSGEDYDGDVVDLTEYTKVEDFTRLEQDVDGLAKKTLVLPLTYLVQYGIVQAYSGKMSSGSTAYRMAYYVAPKNCKVTIHYKRTSNSSYNGRYGVVSSLSELEIGQTAPFVGRFAQDTDGTYTTTLTEGQVLYCMIYTQDEFSLFAETEMDTVETVEGLLLAPDNDKPRIDFLFGKDYSEESLSPSVTQTNRILQQVGIYDSRDGYNIAIYEVNAKDIIHLRLAKVSPAVWQFQNTVTMTTVPETAANRIVGTVHLDAIDEYVVVPSGATHLMVCQLPTNNNFVGKVTSLYDLQLNIVGNGTTPITRTAKLVGGKRYVANINNFQRGDDRGSYIVFRIKCGDRTICDYNGANIVPDKVYFELGADETQLSIYTRIASGVECSVSFSEIRNLGIFDFTNYEKELVRIYNARKTFDSDGVSPFIMLHFSDLHADSVRLKRLISYYNTMVAGIDEILHTGDAIHDTVTADSFDFWDECGAQRILNCIGNHDVWTTVDYTPAENFAYDIYFKPYIDGGYWGTVVQPDEAEANGLCYYYKDFSTKKIRLIVLDYRNPSGQISWLNDVLADAITNGLSVITAVHYPIELTTPFNTAFDISRFASLGTSAASSFVTAVDTFISNGGEFVCWLTGHTHKDFCGVREINGRKQVAICIDCAALRNDGLTRYRAEQTKSQDCFNMLAVNVNTKILTIWRVGEDTDGLQRHKGSMCINYQSGELIYTD